MLQKIKWNCKKNIDLQYRFTIAFENEGYPNYCTEKIMDAFISRTIPIYWGDKNIEKIINKRAFVNCNVGINQITKIIEKVKKIEENQNTWLEMVNEPIFLEENYIEKKKKKFEDFLYNIIEKEEKKVPKSLAVKRIKQIIKLGSKGISIKHKLHKLKCEIKHYK